jgi:Outer membrane protein beta-barrel domain
MKKIVFAAGSFLLFTSIAFSQSSKSGEPKITSNAKKINLLNRPGDHLMIQLSYDHWLNMPDSIKTHQKGLSKGINIYFMLDRPLKGSKNLSVGFGLGIGTSNIVFRRVNVGITSLNPTMPFTSEDSSNHFKRYKLATTYLEAPVELRYFSKPNEPNKSWKAALGLKFGTLLNAHTRGRILVDGNNNVIETYTEKENSKRFISGTRVMATARIGYGIISLFGSYQLNTVLKSGAGPAMELYQLGITISGL